MKSIEEGLDDSVCKDCRNWIFYDWYICNVESKNKSDHNGFLMLPILECEDFKAAQMGG